MLRPLSGSDQAGLLELLNRCLPFDPLTSTLLAEKVWEDPDFHPEAAWVAETEGSLTGFAMGVLRSAGELGHLKFLCVSPARRRQGQGAELLERVERRLSEQGARRVRVAESNPNYLVPGVDVRHTAGLLFLEKHGYRKIGETFNLFCDLAGDHFVSEAPPSGIRLTRARPEDRPALREFLDRCFPAWVYEVERMLENDPVSLHLAWSDDSLAGFAGYDGNNLGTGWFGPMGTDPARRSRGLGRLLLRRCLDDLKRQGRSSCTIPWVGPYGFYARHSLSRIERVFWRYEKTL